MTRMYRMSGAGTCPRALCAEMLGYSRAPTPGWLAKAADEGKWHEGRIVKELIDDHGYQISDRQKEVIIHGDGFELTGHIDGIVSKDGTTRLLEIKTMSQYEFERWKKGGFNEFARYADQITCYMDGLGLNKALLVIKNRSSGYMEQREIPHTPSDPDTIYNRLLAVEKCVAKSELYPSEFNPADIDCRRCFYRSQVCLEYDKSALSPATETELLHAAVLVWEGKAQIDEGKAKRDEGKDTLAAHLSSVSPDKPMSFTIGGVIISRFRVPAYGDSIISYPRKRLEEVVPEDFLSQVRANKPPEWRVSVQPKVDVEEPSNDG